MRAALAVILLAACKGKEPPPAPTPRPVVLPDASVVDAGPVTTWTTCEAALKNAPKTPAMRLVQTLLEACQPCGDWRPLTDWNTRASEGGPTRASIEAAMLACKGYCNSDAKTKFLGSLNTDRGKGTRGPWRPLGEVCKADISAVPDARYVSGVFFALDRIGRAVAERPDLAPLLETFDVPLPAISISGFGFDLAHSPVTSPDAGPLAITVTPTEIRIATLPHGKLGKDGITTIVQGESYPGVLVKSAKDLDAAIAKLGTPIEPGSSIAVFAPHAMLASRLIAVLAVTGERPRVAQAPNWLLGDVRIAVTADKGPPGWPLAGSIPIALRITADPEAIKLVLDDNPDEAIAELKKQKVAIGTVAAKLKRRILTPGDDKSTGGTPDALVLTVPALAIMIGPKTTVDQLAKVLGAAVYFDVKSVALISARP